MTEIHTKNSSQYLTRFFWVHFWKFCDFLFLTICILFKKKKQQPSWNPFLLRGSLVSTPLQADFPPTVRWIMHYGASRHNGPRLNFNDQTQTTTSRWKHSRIKRPHPQPNAALLTICLFIFFYGRYRKIKTHEPTFRICPVYYRWTFSPWCIMSAYFESKMLKTRYGGDGSHKSIAENKQA